MTPTNTRQKELFAATSSDAFEARVLNCILRSMILKYTELEDITELCLMAYIERLPDEKIAALYFETKHSIYEWLRNYLYASGRAGRLLGLLNGEAERLGIEIGSEMDLARLVTRFALRMFAATVDANGLCFDADDIPSQWISRRMAQSPRRAAALGWSAQ